MEDCSGVFMSSGGGPEGGVIVGGGRVVRAGPAEGAIVGARLRTAGSSDRTRSTEIGGCPSFVIGERRPVGGKDPQDQQMSGQRDRDHTGVPLLSASFDG